MTSLQQQQQQQQHQQHVSNNINPTMMNATATGTGTGTGTDPSTSASTAAIAIASFACEYDPELSPIPDQQAWVVLDLYGNIIRSSSTITSSSLSSNNADLIKDVPALYKMIVESTSLVLAASASASTEGEAGSGSGSAEGHIGLKRMTITFDNNNNADNNNADNNAVAGVRYIIAHDIYHIYIIQTLVVSQ
jgi:hypothetical protein